MEKIIFFGLVLPIFAFVIYLGGNAIMKGMSAKNANKEDENSENNEIKNPSEVKKNTIVIDVGINKTNKGIVGDVAFDEVSKNAKALTPVPGGVGPMTIACLLKNTIDCFKRSQI